MVKVKRFSGLRYLNILLVITFSCTFLFNGVAFTEPGSDLKQKRLAEVEVILRDWLGLHQEDRSARFKLAQVLSQQGKLEEAVEEYDQLLEEAETDDVHALLAEAESLFKNDRPAHALLVLRKLSRLSPKYGEVYRQKVAAWRLISQGIAGSEAESAPGFPRAISEKVVITEPPEPSPVVAHAVVAPTVPEPAPEPAAAATVEAVVRDAAVSDGHAAGMLEDARELWDNDRPLQALVLLRKYREAYPDNEATYKQWIEVWRELLVFENTVQAPEPGQSIAVVVAPAPAAVVAPAPAAVVAPEPVAVIEPEPVAVIEPEPVAVIEPEPVEEEETQEDDISTFMLETIRNLRDNDRPLHALVLLRKYRTLYPHKENTYQQWLTLWKDVLPAVAVAQVRDPGRIPAAPIEEPQPAEEPDLIPAPEYEPEPVAMAEPEPIEEPELAQIDKPAQEKVVAESVEGEHLLDSIRSLQAGGNMLQALALLRKYRSLHPGKEDVYQELLWSWRQALMGDEDQVDYEDEVPLEPAAEDAPYDPVVEVLEDEQDLTLIEEEIIKEKISLVDRTAAEKMAEVGRELMLEGLFDEAKEVFLKLVAEDPEDVPALQALAECCLYLGNYGEGIAAGSLILDSYPDDVDALVTLSILCNYSNRNKLALRYVTRANVIAPDRADVRAMHYQLTNWYGSHDRDMIELEKSIALDRSDVETVLALGRVPHWERRSNETIQYYDDVLAEDPTNLEALLGLGEALIRKGMWEDAEWCIVSARELYPDNPDARDAWNRLARAKEPELNSQYRVRETSFYDLAQNEFTRDRFYKASSVQYSHRVDSRRKLLIRSLQGEEWQELYNHPFIKDYYKKEYHVASNVLSVGLEQDLPRNLHLRLRVDSNSFTNKGNYEYNLPGEDNEYSGYCLLSKVFPNRLITAAFGRDLFLNTHPHPYQPSGDLSLDVTDTYILAYDVDLSRDVSVLTSVSRAYYTTDVDYRGTYRVRARYRLPVKETIQLQCEVKFHTHPEERERAVFLNIRDRFNDRIWYKLDYNVAFKSLTDTNIETHTTGLLLQYDFENRMSWYLDSRYTFDREDSHDEIHSYQTGLRATF